MSASRQKKLRKQQQNSCAPATPEKKGMSKGLKKLLCVVGVIALVAIIFFSALVVTDSFAKYTTAATIGDRDLSGPEISYWLSDTYAEEQSYMSYLIDTELPLSEQTCPEDGFDTWYDYMLDLALTKAASTYAVYDEAVAAGVDLSEESQATVDSQLNMIETYCTLYGFGTADSFLAANYGAGCTMDSYEDYLTVNTLAQQYVTDKYAEAEYTDEELDAYYAENADDVDVVSYRVFELFAETTTDENGETVVTEEAMAIAEEKAIAMAEASKGSEETFLQLAKENTAEELRESYDADVNTKAPNTVKGQTSEALRDWFCDDMRAAGDTYIAENDDATGFYVILYVGDVDMSIHLPAVRHILIQPEQDEEGNLTEDAWAAAEEKANALLEEYLAGEQTDEAFAALADANTSDTGSTGNGGLYEDITPGQMVDTFDAWCFDPTRAAGDTGVIETSYGYHVMYFKALSEDTYKDLSIVAAKRNSDYTQWEESMEADVTYTIENTKYIPVI